MCNVEHALVAIKCEPVCVCVRLGQLLSVSCSHFASNLYWSIILTKHYVGGKSQS